MFIRPILLVAEDFPTATPSINPTPQISQADGLLDKLIDAATIPTEDLEIPAALNKLWKISMEGGMYKTVSFIGIIIAVFAVGFWCVKLYKTLEEGGLRPLASEMVLPVILVVMLSNSGKNMREMTLGTRDAMNSFNATLNRVIDADMSLRSAVGVLGKADAIMTLVDNVSGSCQAITEFNKYHDCMTTKGDFVKLATKGLDGSWPNVNTNSSYGAQWQKEIDQWKDYTTNYTKNRFDVKDLNKLREGSLTSALADIRNIHTFQDTAELRGIILSMRGAFLYIIEVMMLVTALVGPIFLALSLFPVGFKPLITWGTSFLTLGFCKICFSLISGLSSLAMVLAGPNNVDMLVTSVVLGLLAPVLAISVASGSGLATLSSVAQSAQGFGFNSGVGFYNLGGGKGSPSSPDSHMNTENK
jgi:hypothetical protein